MDRMVPLMFNEEDSRMVVCDSFLDDQHIPSCQVIYGKITLCDLAGSERLKKSEVSRSPSYLGVQGCGGSW